MADKAYDSNHFRGLIVALGAAAVISSCDAAEVLEFIEAALDAVARLVDVEVIGDQALASGVARNDGRGIYFLAFIHIEVLAERDIDFPLPGQANFRDHIEAYEFDAKSFRAKWYRHG